VSDMTIYFIEV